jgi:hypothetical protein
MLAFGLLLGCSSPQKGGEEEVIKTTPKEEGPQCFQGCMLNSSGECSTEGNVMDWSGSETETIACDPRCCEAGAKNLSGSTDPDGDGIFDEADQCPDKPEDRDNFQDDDGCPDEDNDGDGIPDDSDLCPLDAEDIDGFQDDDGCNDP